MSFDNEAIALDENRESLAKIRKVYFKIGPHARLGNLMDAYREHQGTETAGYESKACSVEPLPRQQAKSLGTDNDCW